MKAQLVDTLLALKGWQAYKYVSKFVLPACKEGNTEYVMGR
jgi:hypothetical protein